MKSSKFSFKKKKFKALIVDVDGTLVPRFDTLPSLRVTEAIAKACEKLHVGLATSRPLAIAKPILDHLQLSGPSIVTTGAEIIDSKTRKILFQQPINLADLPRLEKIITDTKVTAIINENGTDEPFERGKEYKNPLDFWFPNITIEIAEKVMGKLSFIPGISFFYAESSIHHGIDIIVTHTSATKQHGIFELARILEIETHEIIAIGNDNNDFPLLMACGFRVAIGNAVKELKEIADYVAPSVEEDGVADVIEKFIL